jgi:hypothetical protein
MQAILVDWLGDWESLDHERYRQNYSQTEYYAHNRDFKNWDAFKLRTNRKKTRIDVEYSDLNIFKYPGEDDLVLMQFRQDYKSSNFDLKSPKELYWHKEQNRWEIVYEGSRIFPKIITEIVENRNPDGRPARIR